jgi:hypothetical protein
MNSDLNPLIIVFSFIILMILIRRFFQWQRHKLWHETARLALEKGQPITSAGPDPEVQSWRSWRRRRGATFDFRRGLILLAVSAGMYFSGHGHVRDYVLIPAFIGAAFLVMGIISLCTTDKTKVHERDSDPADRV